MSITHVATLVENDHAIVFLKTDDKELHALEFGEHHNEAPKEHKHNHHNEHLDGPHSQPKHHTHSEKHEHADHKADHYAIHLYSPITTRSTPIVPPAAFQEVKVANLAVDALNHTLKHEWHSTKGTTYFRDAQSFVTHVVSTHLGLSVSAPQA